MSQDVPEFDKQQKYDEKDTWVRITQGSHSRLLWRLDLVAALCRDQTPDNSKFMALEVTSAEQKVHWEPAPYTAVEGCFQLKHSVGSKSGFWGCNNLVYAFFTNLIVYMVDLLVMNLQNVIVAL